MGRGGWGPKNNNNATNALTEEEALLGLTLPHDVNPPPPATLPSAPGMMTIVPRVLTPQEIAASEDYLPVENAIKHQFNHASRQWEQIPIRVQLARGYFARGVTRIAFRIRVFHGATGDAHDIFVAKFLDSNFLAPLVGPVTREMLFHDAMGQIVAGESAYEFNRRLPPRPIQFLPIYILEFVSRRNKPLAFMEPPLPAGNLIKHNNNNGVVLSPFQTPQAFGHFTWETKTAQSGAFNRLVVDMQGVGGVYTDPQIHTHNHQGFGIGNQGKEGVQKFLSNHTCNAVCLCLGLVRLVNGKKAEPWPPHLQAQVTQYREKYRGAPPQYDPYTGACIDKASGKAMVTRQPAPLAENWQDQLPPQPRPMMMPPGMTQAQMQQMMRMRMPPPPPPPPSNTTIYETIFLAGYLILSLAAICGWGVARTLDKPCSKMFPFISIFLQVQGITGALSGAVALIGTLMARGISPSMSRLFVILAAVQATWIVTGATFAFGPFVEGACRSGMGFGFLFWMVILDLCALASLGYLLGKRVVSAKRSVMAIRPVAGPHYSAISTSEPV